MEGSIDAILTENMLTENFRWQLTQHPDGCTADSMVYISKTRYDGDGMWCDSLHRGSSVNAIIGNGQFEEYVKRRLSHTWCSEHRPPATGSRVAASTANHGDVDAGGG